MPDFVYPILDPAWDIRVIKFRIIYILEIEMAVSSDGQEIWLDTPRALTGAELTQLNNIMTNANAGLLPDVDVKHRAAFVINIVAINQALKAALPGKRIFFIGVTGRRMTIVSLDVLTAAEKTTVRNTIMSFWQVEI